MQFSEVRWIEVSARLGCFPVPSKYILDFRFGVFDEPINNPLDDLGDLSGRDSSSELELE